MKLIDTNDYRSQDSIDMELAIARLTYGYSDGGTIEAIQADLDATRRLLAKFMAKSVTTVGQLNELAGYERFKEVTG